MIRTRDFVAFGAVFVFLSYAIGATWLTDAWNTTGQTATAIDFSTNSSTSVVMEGAVSESYPDIPRENNISRLREKIAAGEGDVVAGDPIFTSVDDIVATSTITDGSPSTSVLIGHTLAGGPLMSDDLWRFIGFSDTEKIGIAIDGTPIFGVHPNPSVLDSCGGVDEGNGYRYYLITDKETPSGCYGLQ